MRTIRYQLLIGLLCATFACVAGVGALLYHTLFREASELADLQLREEGELLDLQMRGQQLSDIKVALAPGENDPEEVMVTQAWSAQGAPLHTTVSPGLTALPHLAVNGYIDMEWQGKPWRLYGQARSGMYVQIAQPVAERRRLAFKMARRAGWPLLAIALIFGGLIVIVVRRALRPLDRLAHAVVGQDPAALQPLDPEAMAPDLRPVVLALNALMGKFEQAMAAQQTFVADAAHELRSPLTALKLQLQLVERAENDAARVQALARMHERLDRGSHMVRQLLSLARHEPGLRAVQWQPVALTPLLAGVVADHSALADSRDIDLGVEPAGGDIVLQADADGLRVLLNNLVDNAVRYTQRGGRVDLLAGTENGRAFLQVRDNGPGVKPEQRERLFDRFFRPDGNEVWGCGLGLSIVRNIADHHRAQVRLEDSVYGQGLSVTVLFA
jgi:two-component system OmpR family sensor kinase